MTPYCYEPLPRSFFEQTTLRVARELLGCYLVRTGNGARLSGRIIETEAYIGEEDQACHAKAGRTPRTEVMYGPAGVAYVYFTYGIHWMLNVITEKVDFPAAVLIRAVEPLEGIDLMRERRGQNDLKHLCSGPAKLTQAFGIERRENGLDLCTPGSRLFLGLGQTIPCREICRGPRIGINYAQEPWRSKPWRFFIRHHPCVSHPAGIKA
jgi:DNA-3-methyladenine glycosylase